MDMKRQVMLLIIILTAIVFLFLYFYMNSPVLYAPGECNNIGPGESCYAEGEEKKTDCNPGYTKCSLGDSFTCCSDDTHKCCPGGICCPKSSGEACGSVSPPLGDTKYYCTVSEEDCTSKGMRRCSGKGYAAGKSSCCPLDSECGFGAYGVPICEYPNGCPSGKFECWTNGGIFSKGKRLCCRNDLDDCKPLKGEDKSTKACVPKESSCDTAKGEFYCKGEGEWHNAECCKKGQTCQHDVGGYAKCQGNPKP